MQRILPLQRFIDQLEIALRPRISDGSVEGVVSAVFGALKKSGRTVDVGRTALAPSSDLLQWALQPARETAPDLAALASAFVQLEPQLNWVRGKRRVNPGDPIDFHSYIVGPNALEPRPDAEIGVSLIAPHCEYVDHHHPPAEVYLVLSPGEWRQRAEPWFEPGVGGTVYNEPHIIHNMRSSDVPLIAFWCLPLQ